MSGVTVPTSRSEQFTSIRHLETPCSSIYFDRPCSTAPGATWGPDVDPRVGGMILFVGGALLTVAAAACIIASAGVCTAPIAAIAFATGSGTLVLAGTITVGGVAVAAGVAGVAGGTGIMLNAPRPTGGGGEPGLPSRGDLKKLGDGQYEKITGQSAHDFKDDIVGGQVSRWNIYVGKDNMLYLVNSTGAIVPTYTAWAR